jgi:hypothetical protein
MQIIKSSGRPEPFERRKLVASLMRSGAPEAIAREIAEKVEGQLERPFHTRHIYRMAKKLLHRYNRASGMRYSIKRAIQALGPTGYPFEKYVARILKARGYVAETNRMVQGFCVTHEVDVFAVKEGRHCIVECKHHANGDKPTDVKIALYVYGRFADIRRALERDGNGGSYEGWLVTNTRCTADAIAYAECMGLRIVSWRYPDKGSLEQLIEEQRLYPVTILPAATRQALQALTDRNIILVNDIEAMDTETLVTRTGIDRNTASLLKRQADELCPAGRP